MKSLFLLLFVCLSKLCQSQAAYDSVSISRSTIENHWHGPKWPDSLRSGKFRNHITDERIIWRNSLKAGKTTPAVISLANKVRANGTADVSKCFIPRHSVNFYKNGKIDQYMLVCFECDGIRFSNEPARTFIKSVDVRDRQMLELKKLFHGLL